MFPEAGLGVSVATDGAVYQSDVYAASHSFPVSGHHHHQGRSTTIEWGGRAVLVLVGIRLGLDCVNPVYYDTIKVTFPLTDVGRSLLILTWHISIFRRYTRFHNLLVYRADDLLQVIIS